MPLVTWMGPFPAPADGVEEAKIQWQEMADATVGPSNLLRTNKQTESQCLEIQPKLSGLQQAGGFQRILLPIRLRTCLPCGRENHEMGHLATLEK